jgi:hypothetical protein
MARTRVARVAITAPNEDAKRSRQATRSRKKSTFTGFSWWPQGGMAFDLCLETGFKLGTLRQVDGEWNAYCLGQSKMLNPRLTETAAKRECVKWVASLCKQMVEPEMLPDATRTEVPA